MARMGVGRKKIPIRKIENRSNLDVTFSKRRSGIFKKASELTILCDCHVAVIIFSVADKIYAFGHPSAESIFNRFIKGNLQQDSVVHQIMESHRDDEFRELNEEIVEHDAIIQAKKTREKAMNELLNNRDDKNHIKHWWLTPQEEQILTEAEEMVTELDEFKHFIDSSGTQKDSSLSPNDGSSRRTDGDSISLPPRGGFSGGGPLTPAGPHLASIPHGYVGPSDKGKAPMWDWTN